MSSPLKTLVREFGWVHTGIGFTGNTAFFIGSIFFLPTLEAYKIWGIWLFIIGAGLMMVGAFGDLLVKIYEVQEKKHGRAVAGAFESTAES